MNYEERIERRPTLAGGETVMKATRVTLRTLWRVLPKAPRPSRFYAISQR
jgi:hypothetical protein